MRTTENRSAANSIRPYVRTKSANVLAISDTLRIIGFNLLLSRLKLDVLRRPC